MASSVCGAAIIGYGGIGRLHHKKWLTSLPEFTLRGVWDIDPAACANAREDGLSVYENEAALLADPAVSLVVVATPNDTHYEICLRAMKAGKHVICEKPVALNSAELEGMLACAEQNGVVFTVDQNRRWDADFATLLRVAKENRIGRIYQVESRVYGSRGIPGDWRKEKAHGGGMVLDWGVHLIDQALQFAGSRRLVSLSADLDYVFGGECDDGFSIRLTFEDGLRWLLEVRTNNYISVPRWYAAGENGTLAITDWDCHGEIVRKVAEDGGTLPVAAASGMSKTMAPRRAETLEHLALPQESPDIADFYRHIKAAIDGAGECDITPAQLRRTMAVIETVFCSAKEQKTLKDLVI